MKTTIKTIIFLLLFSYGMNANAEVRFGVKAGVNLSNVSQDFRDSDFEFKTKMKLGFHVGPIIDFGFSDALSLQTGVLFSTKGFSMDLEDGLANDESVDGYARSSFSYIEIPLNVIYKINNFQLYAGPYLAIGMGGTSKWDYTLKGSGPDMSEVGDSKNKAVFGSVGAGDLDPDESAYSALDLGLNFGLGYKLGPIVLNAGYSLGMGNLQPDFDGMDFDPKDFKYSNRVITVSASFLFGE